MDFIKYTFGNNFIVFTLQLIVNISLGCIIVNYYTVNSAIVEGIIFYVCMSLIAGILLSNFLKYRRYQRIQLESKLRSLNIIPFNDELH